MIQNIPVEITIASFSTIALLSGYIWNSQGKKIDKIIQVQEQRPCHIISRSIVQIQTDIDWIKQKLK